MKRKERNTGGGLLNTRQAAEHLGLNPSTLYKYRKNGQGPAYHQDAAAKRPTVLYRREDLDGWFARKFRRVETSESITESDQAA